MSTSATPRSASRSPWASSTTSCGPCWSRSRTTCSTSAPTCAPRSSPSRRTRRCGSPRSTSPPGRLVRRVQRRLSKLDSFILPGGTPGAALLHVARTTARRAERCGLGAGRARSGSHRRPARQVSQPALRPAVHPVKNGQSGRRRAVGARRQALSTGGLHHVEVWVPDLAAAKRSWGWLLGALGWTPYQDWPAGRSWRHGTTYLVLEQSPALAGRVHDRLAPGLNHLAFHAGPPHAVDRLVAPRRPTAGRCCSPTVTRTRAARTATPATSGRAGLRGRTGRRCGTVGTRVGRGSHTDPVPAGTAGHGSGGRPVLGRHTWRGRPGRGGLEPGGETGHRGAGHGDLDRCVLTGTAEDHPVGRHGKPFLPLGEPPPLHHQLLAGSTRLGRRARLNIRYQRSWSPTNRAKPGDQPRPSRTVVTRTLSRMMPPLRVTNARRTKRIRTATRSPRCRFRSLRRSASAGGLSGPELPGWRSRRALSRSPRRPTGTRR